MHLYRTLQVQQALFHHCFELLYLPSMKVLLMAVSILGTYGAIRIPGRRRISMAFGAFGVCLHLSRMLRTMSRFSAVSEDVLNSARGRDSYVSKCVLSCNRLNVRIGQCYTVSRTTVLVVFEVIIQATITILISWSALLTFTFTNIFCYTTQYF